jgi:hypothetical protein
VEGLERENTKTVLAHFGVESARRAKNAGSKEEVILITEVEFARVDVGALTLSLMDALPRVKVALPVSVGSR